jgi:hypothetical protein
MNEISTQIDISASASIVWAILTDFGAYRRWNPFIRAILGKPRTGNSIEVTLKRGGADASRFRPRLVHVREARELRWREQWTLPGLYASEHRFRIEALPAGGVRFHHSERANGIMVPFLRRRLKRNAEPAFHAMNIALKARAERAEEQSAVAAASAPT